MPDHDAETPKADLPILEMLWEDAEPAHALTKRFKFGDAAQAAAWVASTLDEHWGIKVLRCERIVISAGNAMAWTQTDNGRMIAKWCGYPFFQTRLAKLAPLVSWLHERGLPVSAPVPSKAGELQVLVDHLSLGVQRVIEATMLDAEDNDQVLATGRTMAELHKAMAAYPDAMQIDTNEPTSLTARVHGWIENALESKVPTALIDALGALLKEIPDESELPKHLVHNDYRGANILCRGGQVEAIIDFEEVSYDYRVADIAHAGVQLSTHFRNWLPISQGTRKVFLDAYRAVLTLSPAEETWLRTLMLGKTLSFLPHREGREAWAKSAEELLQTGPPPGGTPSPPPAA